MKYLQHRGIKKKNGEQRKKGFILSLMEIFLGRKFGLWISTDLLSVVQHADEGSSSHDPVGRWFLSGDLYGEDEVSRMAGGGQCSGSESGFIDRHHVVVRVCSRRVMGERERGGLGLAKEIGDNYLWLET